MLLKDTSDVSALLCLYSCVLNTFFIVEHLNAVVLRAHVRSRRVTEAVLRLKMGNRYFQFSYYSHCGSPAIICDFYVIFLPSPLESQVYYCNREIFKMITVSAHLFKKFRNICSLPKCAKI